MLYQFHQLQRAAAAPLHSLASALGSLWRDPASPWAATGLGRVLAAGAEAMERGTRDYSKPGFGLKGVNEEVVAIHPFCTLRRFVRAEHRGRAAATVLVVAPLSGHHASLLRDTVATLLAEHEVAVTDWTDAALVAPEAGGFSLDDYVAALISFFRRLGPDLHVLAVCQPAVPVLAAVALLAEAGDPARPRSMILMGGPVDARIRPSAVGRWATAHSIEWFEQSMIHRVPPGRPGAGRRVCPGFLLLRGFAGMNPGRHLDAQIALMEDVVRGDPASADRRRAFYDDYLAVMDLPAEYYLDTIRAVFHQFDLARGRMMALGRRVDPGRIGDVALMTVEGGGDDITSIGQTEAAHILCANLPSSLRRHRLQPMVGHYGLFSGRRWREEIYPDVRDFIRAH